MKRFVVLLALVAMAACTSAVPAPAPSASAPLSVATSRAIPQSGAPATIGSMFDPPPPAPGYQWTRDGVAVPFNELTTAAGSEHCDFQSATFLRVGWPLGTIATNRLEARQYIRDPQGVITGKPLRQRLDLHATLPNDARPTGYRYSTAEIHVSPSDQDEFIYVVGPLGTERWPRSDPMTLCF